MHNEVSVSSPTAEQLATWRIFFEAAYALIDLLDDDLQVRAGMSLRWYDVLVQLEEAPEGRLRMTELARKIVASTSGLTRVVDKLEAAGLVRRERLEDDRRVVEVVLTSGGNEALQAARPFHRDAVQRYFVRHLDDGDLEALGRAMTKVRDDVRPLRADYVARSRRRNGRTENA